MFYIDCIGGVVGDMLFGALLDVGVDFDVVWCGLECFLVEGLMLETELVVWHGIVVMCVIVCGADEQLYWYWLTIWELIVGMLEFVHEVFWWLVVVEGCVHGIEFE